MKYINVAGNKMTRDGRKMAKHKGCLFFKSPVFTSVKLKSANSDGNLLKRFLQQFLLCFSFVTRFHVSAYI